MDAPIWDETELILHIRWTSGLTQRQFGVKMANLTGREKPFSRTTVARWENGSEIPHLTLPFLVGLAQLGQTTPRDLCCKLGYGRWFHH